MPLLVDKLDTVLAPWLAQYGIHVALDVASLKAQVLKYLTNGPIIRHFIPTI